MGQHELLKILENQRVKGDEKFYKPKEVIRLLRHCGVAVSEGNIRRQLMKLRKYNYLSIKLPSLWRREDRIYWSISFRYRLNGEDEVYYGSKNS